MILKKGRIVLSRKGKLQVEVDGKVFNPSRKELSLPILEDPKAFEGKEVELEMEKGQPKRIRPVGEKFIEHSSPVVKKSEKRGAFPRENRKAYTFRKGEFYNPYNFVPAPPRKKDDPDLGDHRPPRHDIFDPNLYSGRIRVQMEVVTPLLTIDPEGVREKGNEHKIYPVFLDEEGLPYIPASSIRGMLRTAYETVTNSRFYRFELKRPLGYRPPPQDFLSLVPAIVKGGKIHLLPGTSNITPKGPKGPLYAAWLPRYPEDKAVKYLDGSLPQHGDEVECLVRKVRHRSGRFEYWKVEKIAKSGGIKSDLGSNIRKIHGWVCITNRNIGKKHDERVFFIDEGRRDVPGPFEITKELKEKWRNLMDDYYELHEKEIERRKKEGKKCEDFLGEKPGETAFSRHICLYKEYCELKDGFLCYALPKFKDEKVVGIEKLYPVAISRDLYPASPCDLLDESLRPATSIKKLSPADRVFGWVRSGPGNETPSAFRGLLRVGPVKCKTPADKAVSIFEEEGLPLAILAEPKPQQGRFYVARNKEGEAQEDGLSKKDAGYSEGKGLRGRKVYPHHAGLPEGYWDNPLEDRTQQGINGYYQEYRRPGGKRDSQNRSVLGWVNPGTIFTFDIHFLNLSKAELGALLWILDLPDGYYLRFGGGKPLGFGSVRLTIDSCEIHNVESLRKKYSFWNPPLGPECGKGEFINAFKEAVLRAYGDGEKEFEDVPFIKAFLRACKGFDDKPIHYPRPTKEPQPDGENFKWFTGNEKGSRLALKNLVDDEGFPFSEKKQKKKQLRY